MIRFTQWVIDNIPQGDQFSTFYQQLQQASGTWQKKLSDQVSAVLGPLQDQGASVPDQIQALRNAGITSEEVQATGQQWPQLTG